MKKKQKYEAAVEYTRKGTSKIVKIAWFPRKHREGDVWVTITSRIVKGKRVYAPTIRITDDTINILLGAIHRIRTNGEFRIKDNPQ